MTLKRRLTKLEERGTLTREQLRAMSDEELEALLESYDPEGAAKLRAMSDEELEAYARELGAPL